MLFFVVWTFYYRVIRVWKKDFPWVTFQRMLLLIAVQVIIAKKNLKVGNTFQAISKHSNQHGTTCINTHRWSKDLITKNVDEVLFGYTYKGLYFSVNIFGISATTVNTSQKKSILINLVVHILVLFIFLVLVFISVHGWSI